jgi:hypothetical protein
MGGLNPNIILSIGQNAQQQQPPNLLGQYQAMQQIQANKLAMQAQQQNYQTAGLKQQEQQMALQQQQVAAQQQQQLVALLQKHGGDVDKAAQEAIANGNTQGFALQKNAQEAKDLVAKTQKDTEEAAKNHLETQQKGLDRIGAMASRVLSTSPELQGVAYQGVRAQAQALRIPGADQLPPVWDESAKAALQNIQQGSITAADQIKQKLEAGRDVETGRHNQAQETQAATNETNLQGYRGAEVENMNASRQLEAKRVGIEGARLGLEKQRYGQQFGDPLQGISQAQMNMAQKYANGDFKLPPAGSRVPGAQAIRQAALALNPNLSDDTFTVKHDFNDPSKTGGKNLATIGRIVGHIGRFEKNSGAMSAMESGSFGMGATVTGTQKATAEDAHAIAAELEKLTSGGVGSVEQTRSWQNALKSSSAGVRQKAVDEISQLIGSQYESMNQTYKAQTQEDLPLTKYVTPAGRQWLQAKGINVQGASSGAAAGPAASPGVTAAPGVPSVGAMFNGEKVLKVTRVK